jgi:hypothetical protein
MKHIDEYPVARHGWRCRVMYEKVYRFVDRKQLDQILVDRAIKPTVRRDIMEGRATFVTPVKSNIHDIIQPKDYEGEEGYILTIDGSGLDFLNEGAGFYIDEENRILNCLEFGWYTTDDIPIEKIINIEFVPRVEPEK